MDAYFKYVKDLSSGGYTSDQIKALLNKQGLSQNAINRLMASIMPPVKVDKESSQKVSSSSDPEDRQSKTFSAYIEYVKSLIRRGDSWTAVDRDLIKRGVGVKDRSKIIGVASKTLALVKKYSTAPKPKLQASTVKPPITSAVNPKVDTRTAPNQSQIEIEKEFVKAAKNLETVAEHLSKAVDKLDAELDKEAEIDPERRVAQERAENDAYARQLSDVSDHLAQIAGKLEEAEDKRNFKKRPAAAARLNTAIVLQPLQAPPPLELSQTTEATLPPGMPKVPTIPLQNNRNVIQEDKLSSDEKRGMMILFSCIVIIIGIVIISNNRTLTWLSLLGLNVVGTVGFNLLLRKLSWTRKDDWFTAAVLQTGLMVPFLIKEFVAPIHFPAYTLFDYLLLATAVTGLVFLQFCSVRALKYIEASVFSVVFNTRILFATIFATVFLGEVNHVDDLIGGLLIFMAVFIIEQKGMKAITAKGVLFAVGAALSISIMNTCEKELIRQVGFEQYIFPMFTIAAIIIWSIVLMRKTKEQIPFRLIVQPQSLLLMVLRACAGIGFSYSLVFGPVATSSYISSLSVVLLVVFGALFLGERDYIRSKAVATITAIAGLTFILLDSLK